MKYFPLGCEVPYINKPYTHIPKEGRVSAVQGYMGTNAPNIEKQECHGMSLFMSNTACNS